MMKRLEATINGRVQGVSFRYHAQQVANELHLTGWVLNQPDGSVHIMAEGPEDKLRQFVRFLHNGRPPARVDTVDLAWSEAAGKFTRFNIRWHQAL